MAISIAGRNLSLGWLKPPPSSPDGTMTLFDHLRELRYRLILSVIAIVVVAIAASQFYRQIYAFLMLPYVRGTDGINNATDIVNIGIAAPFLLWLKIVGLSGLIGSAPVWLYQIWAFIAPGLLAREKKWALVFVGAATPLFMSGVVLAYFMMPKAIDVMLGFTPEGTGVTNMVDIQPYLGFILQMMVFFGLGFLLPLITVVLNLVGVVKATQLAKARTVVIFGCFVFGAIATPSTDPFSMCVLAVPMAVLYVAAELICHASDKAKARRRAEAEAAESRPELTH